MTDSDDNYEEELEDVGGAAPEKKNWKGIIIALLVIITISSLILLAIFFTSKFHVSRSKWGERIQFEEIYEAPYNLQTTWNGTWISDSEYYFRNQWNELILFNCFSNATTRLLDNSTFRSLNGDSYILSPNKQFALLKYRKRRIRSEAEYANYKVIDLQSKKLHDLGPGFDYTKDRSLQCVTISKMGYVAYVFNNNLFIHYDPFNNGHSSKNIKQITSDGMNGKIYNGNLDITYKEFVWKKECSLQWDPSGSSLTYISINNQLVPVYRYVDYHQQMYPEPRELHFPKPGDMLPGVAVRVVPFDGKTVSFKAPDIVARWIDFYVTGLQWIDSDSLIVAYTNRRQNSSITVVCAWRTASCTLNLIETVPGDKGWLEAKTYVIDPKEKVYFTTSVDAASVNQMAQITFQGEVTYLTSDNKDEVIRIVGYSSSLETVFYLLRRTMENQQHLYSYNQVQETKYCLSCDIAESCTYFDASFTEGASFYILTCLGPGVPQIWLMGTSGSRKTLVTSNDPFSHYITTREFPAVEYFEITVADELTFNVRLMLPPILDQGETLHYPLLVYIPPYSFEAPVHYRSRDFLAFLSSNKNIIVATVYPLFTFAHWKAQAHNRLPAILTSVYSEIGRLLTDKSYVNSDRVAIYGKELGGYVALNVQLDPASPFKCAVAEAPITDWTLANAFDAEKYLGLIDNEDGFVEYRQSNLSARAEDLNRVRTLIIHAMSDERIHLIHSTRLINSMIVHQVGTFEMQFYPNENQNSFTNTKVLKHNQRKIISFLESCLGSLDLTDSSFYRDPDGGKNIRE